MNSVTKTIKSFPKSATFNYSILRYIPLHYLSDEEIEFIINYLLGGEKNE